MTREVWLAEEATVTIWEEDGSGGYVEPAVREECFAKDLTFAERTEVVSEGQPGASAKDTFTVPDGFDIDIRSLYTRKATQFDPFLSLADKLYRIQVSCENPRYPGIAPFENDDHVFRNCRCVSGPRVQRTEGEIMEVSLGFRAEEME